MKNMRKSRFGTVGGASVLAAALFWASASYGQSLGEIARQERERRKQEPRQSTYVYTNEDLKRAQILVPEDRERVLARRNESAPEIQARAVEIPALPIPNANIAVPTPEVAILPIGTELQAPLAIPTQKMAKIVARTTHVIVPAQPRISALPAPPLPVVSAELELPAPQQAIQQREVSKTWSATTVVEIKAHSELPTTARLASVSHNRIAQQRQAAGAVALVHFERTKSKSAHKFRSDSVLFANSTSKRSGQHRKIVGVVPLAHAAPATSATAKNLGAPKTEKTSPALRVMLSRRQSHEAIALVNFEAKSRAVFASPVPNVVLAQPASHEIVQRNRGEEPIMNGAHLRVPTQGRTDSRASAMVRIEHGDSLWKLAKEHLGSGTRWRELAEINPEISNPGFIRVGDVIRLPNA